MKVALDSNVLIYAQGWNDAERRARATEVVATLIAADVVVPAQALGEIFAVLTRKYGQSPAAARDVIMRWQKGYAVAPTTERVLVRAIDLVADHRLNIWDAVIFAAAAEAGCGILLSEDLQDGLLWGGVGVINPFREAGWARLRGIVGG